MNGVRIQDAISCSVTKSSYNLTPWVPLERTETGNMGDGQGVKEVLGKGEIGSERECATRHSMKGMSVSVRVFIAAKRHHDHKKSCVCGGGLIQGFSV